MTGGLGITMAARAAQQGNRMFAMTAGRRDKFIEDSSACFLAGLAIALAQFGEQRFG